MGSELMTRYGLSLSSSSGLTFRYWHMALTEKR